MLLSIFSILYELVSGENPDYPEYREQIFNSVGTLTFFMSALVALLFYVVLGRWRMIWFNNVHWATTIFLCAAAGFGISFLLARDELGLIDSYLIRFALFNGLYAALFFVLFSLLFKNFSIFSKRTPF